MRKSGLGVARLLIACMLWPSVPAWGSEAPERAQPPVAELGQPTVPETHTDGATPPARPTSTETVPVYVQPRGVPGGREGGGTRNAESFEVVALLPEDHVALTTHEQPTVYWYVPEPVDAPVEVVVNRGKEEDPLVERPLPGPFAAGIHALDFSQLDLRLEDGVVYRWHVQVRVDPKRRALDRFSGGCIMRVAPSPELSAALGEAGPGGRAAAYARHGIWCDALEAALEAAVEASEAHPSDDAARRLATVLLEQVGLGQIGGQLSSLSSTH